MKLLRTRFYDPGEIAFGLFVVVATCVLAFFLVGIVHILIGPPRQARVVHSNQPYQLNVETDPQTGCQYLVMSSGVTPRLNAAGKPMGCGAKNGGTQP